MKQMHGVAIRPFTAADSAQVQTLLSDSKVAQLAGNIPYPYPDHGAQAWIDSHGERHRSGSAIIRAITLVKGETCIGAISIDQISRGLNASGNLGYWLGMPEEYTMGRLVAAHQIDNPASGRVLEKLGFNELEPQRMTNLSGQYLFRCYEKLL
jgi:ribosomal-protein-alanine N-acetyltransferase